MMTKICRAASVFLCCSCSEDDQAFIFDEPRAARSSEASVKSQNSQQEAKPRGCKRPRILCPLSSEKEPRTSKGSSKINAKHVTCP